MHHKIYAHPYNFININFMRELFNAHNNGKNQPFLDLCFSKTLLFKHEQTMNIFVISLKESLERRTQINERLNSIGVTFNFFDADNITKNPVHEIFKLYSKTKTEK